MKSGALAAIVIVAAVVIAGIAAFAFMGSGDNNNNNDGTDTYTVTFNTDGGSYVPSQTVKSGGKATEPTTSKAGYYFAGWYTNSSGGQQFVFSTPIKSDMTLFAHWTSSQPQTYTVTFNSNQGSYVPSQTVNAGDKASEPTATRAGYSFLGWFTSSTGGTQFDFGNPITSDIVLYAHWSTDTPRTYTVTFNSNGGSSVPSQVVNSGGYVSVPSAPTKSGNIFTGWFTSIDGNVSFDFNSPVTSNKTAYAHWSESPSTYTVTFNSNGGSTVPSQTVAAGGYASLPSEPTKSGYRFDGWYTSPSGSTQFSFGPINSNKTAYAHWTAQPTTYTVTFNSNGGSTVPSQTVAAGGYASLPSEPTMDGYRFDGWYTSTSGSTPFSFGPINSSKTAYAHWTAVPTYYTVSFSSDGKIVSRQTVTAGGYASVPSQPTKDGYRFDGWYTSTSGSTQFSFGPINSNKPAYAHWTAVPTYYTVSFSSDGKIVSKQTVTAGGYASVPSQPTKDGYFFAGWYTSTSGSTQFSFGPINSDKTAYAHWNEIPKNITTAYLKDKPASITVDSDVDEVRVKGSGAGTVTTYFNIMSRSAPLTIVLDNASIQSGSGSSIIDTRVNLTLESIGSSTLKGGVGSTAIKAGQLTIAGSGSLSIYGGDGSSSGSSGSNAIDCSSLTFNTTGSTSIYGGNGAKGTDGAPGPSVSGYWSARTSGNEYDYKANYGGDGGNGYSGGNGGNGAYAVKASSITVKSGNVKLVGGNGGAGGNGGNGGSGGHGQGGFSDYDSKVIHSGDGGNGGNGGAGGNGGNGSVAASCSVSGSASLISGNGGKGGNGGNGGSGGTGGSGEDRTEHLWWSGLASYVNARGGDGGDGGYGGAGGNGGNGSVAGTAGSGGHGGGAGSGGSQAILRNAGFGSFDIRTTGDGYPGTSHYNEYASSGKSGTTI